MSTPAAGPVPAIPPALHTVDALVAFVTEQAGRPIDAWAITALLESGGVRDRDAVERFGQADVFALARHIEPLLPAAAAPGGVPAPLPAGRRVRSFAGIYARGMFFFVPLALQLLALLTVGYSQFASLDFTIAQASVVAMAAGVSFLVTASFTQSLGFLGPLFEEPGKHMLTERVVWRVVGAGVATTVLVGLLVWAAGAVLGAYPPADLRTGLTYYVLISIQAVGNGVFYVLRRYALMVATTVVGLAVVGLLVELTAIDVPEVHWISLAAGIVFEYAAAALVLRRRAADTRGSMRLARMPRGASVLRLTLPHAAYGSLYFLFLLVDRLIAWADGRHPFWFWFRTPYELGLDWALVAVVFALAFLEITVERFSALLVPTAERFPISEVREHNAALERFWRRQLVAVAAIAVTGAALAVGAALLLTRADLLGSVQAVVAQRATRWTFAGAVVGYALLAVGLANSSFLFSMGRPWHVVGTIAPALGVSAAIGITLTSIGPYYLAVVGTAAGALVFAVLSARATRRTLERADYWGYAAY